MALPYNRRPPPKDHKKEMNNQSFNDQLGEQMERGSVYSNKKLGEILFGEDSSKN